MDSLLVNQLKTEGDLIGYPISYDPTITTNPIFHLTVRNNNRTIAKLGFMVVNSPRRKPWEPKENCIFLLSLVNFAGYKGMGRDLMRLLIFESRRLGFPIQLMASSDPDRVHKLYNFYEKLGFTAIPNTEVVYDDIKTEAKSYRLGL